MRSKFLFTGLTSYKKAGAIKKRHIHLISTVIVHEQFNLQAKKAV